MTSVSPEQRDYDQDVRNYVSRLWAEDWDCPEDAVYDTWGWPVTSTRPEDPTEEAAEDAWLSRLAKEGLEEMARDGGKTVPLSAVTRHAYRTSGLAIAITAFVSGALAALGVVAVVAGWHGLGAR